MMIVALLPPSSRRQFPNLSLTFCLMIFPTRVDPVKEIKGILLSSTILDPMSTPPWRTVKTFGLIPFFSRTSAIILAVAMVIIEVCGDPFQVIQFPQIKAIAAFHPKTAFGKLKAVIIPTIPNGFQTSIMKWSGLSELNIEPLKLRKYCTQLILKVHMPYHRYRWSIELLQHLRILSYPFPMKQAIRGVISFLWMPYRFVWRFHLFLALELWPIELWLRPCPSKHAHSHRLRLT